MYWNTSDYAKQDDRKPGVLAHRGAWLHDVPRLMLLCRLLGHKPVVDGYGPTRPGLDARRWVVCDRCGVRPDPQGVLDPDEWSVGERYDEPIYKDGPSAQFISSFRKAMHHHMPSPPGHWPAKATGTLGAELLVGKTFGLLSAEVKVGHGGSEQTLAGHLRLWPFGALYLHTEKFGTWLQRRLNPEGYESREIGLAIDRWEIRTKLWARRDSWSGDDPWWMHGRISLDLVEKLLGPKRYSFDDVDAPVMGWINMPEGDSHQVQLQLKRVRLGRPRMERWARYHWSVEWTSATPIVTRPHRGGTVSASVLVPDVAVETRSWGTFACAVAAMLMSGQRTAYGYQPRTEV